MNNVYVFSLDSILKKDLVSVVCEKKRKQKIDDVVKSAHICDLMDYEEVCKIHNKMIVNAAVQELISLRPGDEIVVANQEEYYQGTPHYSDVRDIVKDNGKLVILI